MKNTTQYTPGSKVKLEINEMTDKLFIQRRRVIEMLYEAKRIIGRELPRIKVRIAKIENERIEGVCYLKKDFIVISEKVSEWSDSYLRLVVWHELGHAFFNAKHNEACPLMHPFGNETDIKKLSESLSLLAAA